MRREQAEGAGLPGAPVGGAWRRRRGRRAHRRDPSRFPGDRSAHSRSRAPYTSHPCRPLARTPRTPTRTSGPPPHPRRLQYVHIDTLTACPYTEHGSCQSPLHTTRHIHSNHSVLPRGVLNTTRTCNCPPSLPHYPLPLADCPLAKVGILGNFAKNRILLEADFVPPAPKCP